MNLSKVKLRIGLEIHVRLLTDRKLFSPAINLNSGRRNALIDAYDLAIPGTMPTLNKECVYLAIRACYAMGCGINSPLTFDRKHYVYADLPAGYQLTQKDNPLGVGGNVNLPNDRRVGIKQVHLEADAAKMEDDRVD